ncbi:MAG: peptide/nickel transport system permease protein [Pseudonocardiales bacterium]|jgi:peptide/nickel transport system permease protein|nr:peptide/nickel transport system permease protein [Pseudonocardiales bacterium]
MTAIPADDAALADPPEVRGPKGGGAVARSLSGFVENKLAVVGLGIVVAFVVFCYLGPLVYHTDQVHIDLSQATLPPSGAHPLGTNEVGYDQLGRLMVGGQSSLEVGIAAALLATVFGTLWGAIAGYAGGFIDSAMMRIIDALLAVPALFLLLFLASIARPTIGLLILVIALISWLGPARLVRGQALTLRTRDYVTSVRLMGGGPLRAILRHIAPNTIGTVVVNATFQVADAILIVATLSFLGLGIPPPAANWGDMLSNGINYTYDGYWWLIYPPGLAIVLVVVAFNLIGDALRDSFEVRLQKR